MKKEVVQAVAKLSFVVVMVIIAAGAQAKAQTLQARVAANIPFDFSVANKKLPAGEYSFGRSQLSDGDLIVQINSKDGHATLSRLTLPVVTRSPKHKGTLVFHRYGDEYFLVQVWPAGGTTGRELPKSRSERDVERKAQDNVGAAAVKAPEMQIVMIMADQR